MKNRTAQGFATQPFVFALAAICFSGSIGLGTVWMRHQISVTANGNKVLEARIAELERHVAETNAQVASAEDPAALVNRNVTGKLGLIGPSDKQVVRMPGDPVLRLAAKQNSEVFKASGPVITINARPLATN